jgi:hypothetical protein
LLSYSNEHILTDTTIHSLLGLLFHSHFEVQMLKPTSEIHGSDHACSVLLAVLAIENIWRSDVFSGKALTNPGDSLYSNKFPVDAMVLARRTISKLSFDYNADLL